MAIIRIRRSIFEYRPRRVVSGGKKKNEKTLNAVTRDFGCCARDVTSAIRFLAARTFWKVDGGDRRQNVFDPSLLCLMRPPVMVITVRSACAYGEVTRNGSTVFLSIRTSAAGRVLDHQMCSKGRTSVRDPRKFP